MFLVSLTSLLFLLDATTGLQLEASEENLSIHLHSGFSERRSHFQPEAKDRARTYIHNFFRNNCSTDNSVLDTQKVKLGPRYFVSQTKYAVPGSPSQPNGTNYIFILKGQKWGTKEDSITLLGAHYDSQIDTPGVDDNGSGMAAMLEVARALSAASKTHVQKYTIIFVAFDFEEMGLVGSREFVYDYLVAKILEPYQSTFAGAIILDTIMNVDDGNFTQTIPNGFGFIFPRETKIVADNKYRGTFLSAIGRLNEAAMISDLNNIWQSPAVPSNYTVLRIIIPFSGLPPPESIGIIDVFRSDHANFWFYNGTMGTLKAVFLTDSTEFRGYMRNCYHKPCDDVTKITKNRLDFLSRTTTMLSNYIFRQTFTNATNSPPSSVSVTPSPTPTVTAASSPVWGRSWSSLRKSMIAALGVAIVAVVT